MKNAISLIIPLSLRSSLLSNFIITNSDPIFLRPVRKKLSIGVDKKRSGFYFLEQNELF